MEKAIREVFEKAAEFEKEHAEVSARIKEAVEQMDREFRLIGVDLGSRPFRTIFTPVGEMDKDTSDVIEVFKQLRDAADGVVMAMEADDNEMLETALGKFLVVAMKMDALK